jgi:hypothetical protein
MAKVVNIDDKKFPFELFVTIFVIFLANKGVRINF